MSLTCDNPSCSFVEIATLLADKSLSVTPSILSH